MRLEGKTAVIVGAGQTPGETIGNGRATSILFAREGAKVFLVDRDLAAAEATAAIIRAEGFEALCHQADISKEADCIAMAAAAKAQLGRIDILHNNVGVGGNDGGPARVSEEGWDRIMDINAKGMMFSCKHVLPVMKEQGGGAIVNISSIAAVARTHMTAYKASKAAVNSLTEVIAQSQARYGIRCNGIMPGLMDTPMAIEGRAARESLSREEIRTQRQDMVPLQGRTGTGWDVAHAALFLASDDAGYITGVTLPVDGGLSA
jgi:NAD(P)-dependent dehydrogenase (short-subunit alcohol dehydrogenase family)